MYVIIIKQIQRTQLVTVHLLKVSSEYVMNVQEQLEKIFPVNWTHQIMYESIATVGEIRVWWRADFQSGSRVLKKVF